MFARSLLFAVALPMISEAVPPKAPEKRHKTVIAGQVGDDPLFWLREKKNPEVIKYLEAENRYTEGALKHTEALQEELYQEMRGRIKEEDLSVRQKVDDYYYYTRMETGKEYPIHCRKKGSLDANEEVILNENELAKGQKFFHLGVCLPSPDHKLLAYSVDTDGSETLVLRVKNLETGRLLPDEIKNSSYTFAWANDNRTFFYTDLDAAKRPYRVLKHALGEDTVKDRVVYEEKDERFSLAVERSRSRQFIFVSSESELSSEVRFLPADQPEKGPVVLRPRENDLLYYVDHHDDRFFIVTDESAKNFKLVTAPVASPGKENWKDFIPYDPAVRVEHVDAFERYLAISERRNGLPMIVTYNLQSGESHNIEFDEPTYDVHLATNPEFKTTALRIRYSSFITPMSIIDYDMVTHEKELKKETPVLGGYDKKAYVSERVFAKAEDGVEIPISLFYRKGTQRDGTAPLWLYGYGAYGITMDATFSPNRVSLVDRGFVFAIAHIRGGGELGKSWYEDGKLLKKKSSFTDFVRCAEFLVEQKYAAPKRIVMNGGSAGGLLMGAVMNLRPDLFTSVIAEVPFVDVLNTMSDPSLPLTVTEYDEWGNPQDPKYYDYIASYSPYDNVTDRQYPNLLVTAGLNDPHVSYWEPAKWVAKQRTLKNQNRVLLLKTNMGAGHSGQSGRFSQLKEVAMEYAFAIDTLHVGQENFGGGVRRTAPGTESQHSPNRAAGRRAPAAANGTSGLPGSS
jgi:oligopeptidase B